MLSFKIEVFSIRPAVIEMLKKVIETNNNAKQMVIDFMGLGLTKLNTNFGVEGFGKKRIDLVRETINPKPKARDLDLQQLAWKEFPKFLKLMYNKTLENSFYERKNGQIERVR